MFVIKAENVNHAYTAGMHYLLDHGVEQESRVGKVLRSPVPVSTVYAEPCQRVLFNKVRDCNPFFHLFECIWMISGRNDVASLTPFNKNMGNYSDDGITFHGAYGHRWRSHFGFDQIQYIIAALKSNPMDRRAVMGMWDAGVDLEKDGKDIPCNDMIKFDAVDGKLNMIVFCRSNDIIWGAYGANAVHMSFLQEYMAAGMGIPTGTYTQISCDFHAYIDVLEKKKKDIHNIDYYLTKDITYQPLILENETTDMFDEDCNQFFEGPSDEVNPEWKTDFFKDTVAPMAEIWRIYKTGKKAGALGLCDNIYAGDWKEACKGWIERRIK